MATELGTAYISIVASTKTLESDIKKSLTGVSRKGAFTIQPQVNTKSLTTAGRDAGTNFTRAFKSNVKIDTDASLRSTVGGIGKTGFSAGKMFGTAFIGALGAMGLAASVGAIFQTAASAAKDVFNTGLGFEKVMNSIQGVTEATVAQMNTVRTTVRALGSDVNLAGTSASDAGVAILELTKGGLSLSDAMAAARGTLQLATAAQISSGDAATYVADALSMWQKPGKDAVHVADLLANAANASSGEASDYAIALSQAGNVAASFGVSMEDTVTSLALFAKFGVKGSDAGTLMKTSLQAITDQGNPAQNAIEALNLQLYEGGKFVGYPEMLRQIAVASENMSQEQFQAATNVLFGSDAMRASSVAANGGSAAFAAMYQAVTKTGGAARMAGAQMQGLPGVMESISNTAEGIKLSLFDLVDDGLGQAGKSFATTFDGWSKWLQENRSTVVHWFTAVSDGAFTAADAFLAFTSTSLDGLAMLLEGFNTAFPKMFDGLSKFGTVLKFLPGFESMGKAMEDLGKAFDGGLSKGPGVLRDISDKVDGLRTPLKDAKDRAHDFLSNFEENLKAGETATKELGVAVDLLPDNKTFKLEINGEKPDAALGFASTKLRALGYDIEQMPDGDFKVVPHTEDAKNKLSEITAAIQNLPSGSVNVDANVDAARAKLNGLYNDVFGRAPFQGTPTTGDTPPKSPGQTYPSGGSNPTTVDDLLLGPKPGESMPGGSRWKITGSSLYDTGGWLDKGYTTVLNKTGKPELVLNPDQTKSLAGALGGAGVDPGSIAPHMSGLKGGASAAGMGGLAAGAQAVSGANTGAGRTEGFMPAVAQGNNGVAGTSSLAGLLNLGNEAVGGLIDTGASMAKMAVSAAATAGVAGGTMGAGAAAGPAASAAAGYGIDLAATIGKRVSSYGFQMASIFADAGIEQAFGPLGAPRWLGYDYTQFAPQLGIQQALTTTAEKAFSDQLQQQGGGGLTGGIGSGSGDTGMNIAAGFGAARNPGGPVHPSTMPGASGQPKPSPGKNPFGAAFGGGASGGMGASSASTAPTIDIGKKLGIYDTGGELGSGMAALNLSGQPEYVLSPQQWDSIQSVTPAGGGRRGRDGVTYNVSGVDMTEAMREARKMQRRDSRRYSARSGTGT